jgi:hypothetical protein
MAQGLSTASNTFKNKHKGSISQAGRVESQCPTYLHNLYRRASIILGGDTTFTEISSQMNLLLMVDKRLIVNLNEWSFLHWFEKNKRKERCALFRPLLTEGHINKNKYNTLMKYMP